MGQRRGKDTLCPHCSSARAGSGGADLHRVSSSCRRCWSGCCLSGREPPPRAPEELGSEQHRHQPVLMLPGPPQLPPCFISLGFLSGGEEGQGYCTPVMEKAWPRDEAPPHRPGSSRTFSLFFFDFFFGMWDLSYPTRDRTRAPCIGSTES